MSALVVSKENGKVRLVIDHCPTPRHRKLAGELYPIVGRYPLTDEQAKLSIDTLAIMLAENRLSETHESDDVKKARTESDAVRKAQEIAGAPP